MVPWRPKFKNKIEENGIIAERVCNSDQTGLY